MLVWDFLSVRGQEKAGLKNTMEKQPELGGRPWLSLKTQTSAWRVLVGPKEEPRRAALEPSQLVGGMAQPVLGQGGRTGTSICASCCCRGAQSGRPPGG